MTDDAASYYSSPTKGQTRDYGWNPLAITVSTFKQHCNQCKKELLIGQRKMRDPKYGNSWPHLECARLELFSRVDNNSCTPPALAVSKSDKPKLCAWCTKEIVSGKDQWYACWMGWVHVECDPGRKSDFVEILERLQQRCPGPSMPGKCHDWKTVEELENSLLDQQQLSRYVDCTETQQTRPNKRKHALAPINLLTTFSSEGGARRLVHEGVPATASDAHFAPDDSSDADSDARSQSTSDMDTDNEPLETRGTRLFGLRMSGPDSRRAGKCPRQRVRKQGPQRRLIHPGTEGTLLHWEPMPPRARSRRERPVGRSEALGDTDTTSGGDDEDKGNSSDSSFIEKDGNSDDDDDDYTPPKNSATSSGRSNASGSGDRDVDSVPQRNAEQPQACIIIVLSGVVPADDVRVECESDSTAESNVQVNAARRCGRQAGLPVGVIDLTESDNETQPIAPSTSPQGAHQLARGCRRLCKKTKL